MKAENIFYMIVFILSFNLTFPLNAHGQEFNDSEMYWLTQNIYHESRGENSCGQLMVAMVTLERLKSGRWGNTIKEVVTAPGQFSWHSDDKSNVPDDWDAWNNVKDIAFLSIMIYNNIKRHGVMYYHNDTVYPYWTKEMTKIIVIGKHTFYKEK